TGSVGVGEGNRIRLLKELRFPHSLGLLYSAFTYFCGFKVNSGEYKLMGLAPYGEPKYADFIREKILDLRPDGSFRMDMSYFAFCTDEVMTSKKFDQAFGGPPRAMESPVTEREMDLAASIQEVTEEIMLAASCYAHQLSGARDLVMAGGVALNCVGNGRILREGPFDRIWIQPAAGDAGGALGAATFVWHQLLDNPRKPLAEGDRQRGSLLGPAYSDEAIRACLDARGAVYRHYETEEALVEEIASLIAAENVVGHMDGRMEFGPRALGNRSIIGDARSPKMQSVMNLKIKFRESFRPFAPSILRERVHDYFEMREEEDSPYMLLVAPVRGDKRLALPENGAYGLDKLKQLRSVVPAITHVDYSARVQTVDSDRNPRFHRILRKFEQKTGCPVLINTSFNVRGEPIVCTPEDALRCFRATNIDALVIGRFLMMKEDQPRPTSGEAERYLSQFQLD
ncbi:MAG TPA: carbamoyltransferase C-terminal domain-containing protein, partial [Vicinamibacteria bacterium]